MSKDTLKAMKTPISKLNTRAAQSCMTDCIRHCVRALLDETLPDLLSIITRYADALAPIAVNKVPTYKQSVQQAIVGKMDAAGWDTSFYDNLTHQLGMDNGTHIPPFFWQIAAFGVLSQPALMDDLSRQIVAHWRESLWIDTPLSIRLHAAPLLLVVTLAAANVHEFPPRQKKRLKPMLDEISAMSEPLRHCVQSPALWDQWLLVRALRLWQMERWSEPVVHFVQSLPLSKDVKSTDAPDWFIDQWDQLR